MPRKQARFSLPSSASSSKTKRRNGTSRRSQRLSLNGNTPSQKTLTQIDWITPDVDESNTSISGILETDDRPWNEHLENKREEEGDAKDDNNGTKQNVKSPGQHSQMEKPIGRYDDNHDERKPIIDDRLETKPETALADFTASEYQPSRDAKRRRIEHVSNYDDITISNSKRQCKTPATPKRSIQLVVPPSQSPDGQPIFFRSPSKSPSSKVLERRGSFSHERNICSAFNPFPSGRKNANLSSAIADTPQRSVHNLQFQRAEQGSPLRERDRVPDTYCPDDRSGALFQVEGSPVIPSDTEDLGGRDDSITSIPLSPVPDASDLRHRLSNRPSIGASDHNISATVIPDSEDEDDELDLTYIEGKWGKESEADEDEFYDARSKFSDDRDSEEEKEGERDRTSRPEVRTNSSISSNTRQASQSQQSAPQSSPLRNKPFTQKPEPNPLDTNPSMGDPAMSSSDPELRADSMGNGQSKEASLAVDVSKRRTPPKLPPSRSSSSQRSNDPLLPAPFTPIDTDQRFIETQSPTQPSKHKTVHPRSEVNEADISTEYIAPSSQIFNQDRINANGNAKGAPKSSPPILTPIQEESQDREETDKSAAAPAAASSVDRSSPEPITVSQLLTESLMETIPSPPLWISQDEGNGT